MLRILILLFVSSVNFLLSEPTATLKIQQNIPVFYQLHVEGKIKSEGTNPKINFNSFTLDMDFSIALKSDEEFAEFVIIPTKFEGFLKFDHGLGNFDFSRENLTFNTILKNSFPFLNTIKLKSPIRIPITNDISFLKSSHEDFPFLPVHNPEIYAYISNQLLNVVDEGLKIKEGKFHTKIRELGLEVFSKERIIDEQYKGDYTFRFLLPLSGKKNGCMETLIGSGKVKNSMQTSQILNTKGEGMLLLIYQKMNCPDKDMNVRYECRIKCTLIPKATAVSKLT